MKKNAESVLFWMGAGWAAVGLASGLGYRELTRSRDFTGFTQVLGSPMADSAALAGPSGLGHVLLTAAFVLLFLTLGRRIQESKPVHDLPAASAVSAVRS